MTPYRTVMKLHFYLLFLVVSILSEVKICEQDFDVAKEYDDIRKLASQSGAIVFFVGLVRDLYALNENAREQNRRIEYIELTHYAGMTESLCQKIINEAHELYSLDAIRVIHRVGKIYASEQIVMVAVTSSHREQAFKACQFIMDYLKTRATLWKKEVGELGENWVGLKEKDQTAASRWSK